MMVMYEPQRVLIGPASDIEAARLFDDPAESRNGEFDEK